MLGRLRGPAVHASFGAGVQQLRIRRYAISPETGSPLNELEDPQSLLNPELGYFVGASFYLDPIAFGVGMYDLSSQYRLISSDPLRYHLAPDPTPGCLSLGKGSCPPLGGSVTVRQDLTLALAWDLGLAQLGIGVHFPRVRERFAFDLDSTLLRRPDEAEIACDDREDPACAERIGFKGWTHWIARDGAPPGFDAALTLGAAFSLRRDTISLGVRYRTFPLRRGGYVALGGVGVACQPNPEPGTQFAVVPDCRRAEPVPATLRESLPQEVAVGGSFVLGRSRLWRLDANLYWLDLCRGGLGPADCPSEGDQTLRLVGLGRESFVLPELTRHRGLQDLYGADIYAAYRARATTTVMFAGHLSSPSVRASSQTAAYGAPWMVGLSLAAHFQLREASVVLSPGYGIDVFLPRDVSANEAAFVPEAATAFEDADGDINAPGASAVLEGRARATNAARYFGLTHTFSFVVRWGETASGL